MRKNTRYERAIYNSLSTPVKKIVYLQTENSLVHLHFQEILLKSLKITNFQSRKQETSNVQSYKKETSSAQSKLKETSTI